MARVKKKENAYILILRNIVDVIEIVKKSTRQNQLNLHLFADNLEKEPFIYWNSVSYQWHNMFHYARLFDF